MTIKIGKYQVTLLEVKKLETFKVSYDQTAAQKEADEIKKDEVFQDLKARAAAIRAARNA